MKELVKDLISYGKKRGRYWLIPLMLMILAFGLLLVISEGSAIAPLIYTIF